MGKMRWLPGRYAKVEPKDDVFEYRWICDSTKGDGIYNANDPDRERDPPAAATPVTFPKHHVGSVVPWTRDAPPPDLQSLFAKIARPTAVADRHLEALNIEIVPPGPVADLVRPAPDGTLHYPPFSPGQDVLANLDIAHKRKDFDARLAELRFDNDTAYRIITHRTLQDGEKTPRLAYMRKFYEGLEAMSPYWDCSLDQYYEALPASPLSVNGEGGRKRQRLCARSGNANSRTPSPSQSKQKWKDAENRDPAAAVAAQGTELWRKLQFATRKEALVSELELPGADDFDRKARSGSCTPEARSRIRYRGRRTACGKDMPEQFRFDAVKNFVEQAVWSFHGGVAVPRRMPLVKIRNLKLPVRQSAVAHRTPSSRDKAKQGIIEGPVLGIQIRGETEFSDQHDSKARLDQLREIGGLLQIAQERHRQGKTETRSGVGKWWTTKPRWGAVPETEAEHTERNNNLLSVLEEVMSGRREKGASSRSASSQKRTPATMWEELKPGSASWDPKTEYQAIGKDPESEYDEVFMVSALNHHISILKLTVHAAYLDFLASGTLPDPLSTDADWCRPKFQRSQWFDLFDVEQRVQAFTALWGVASFLMRDADADADLDGAKKKEGDEASLVDSVVSNRA